MTTAEWKCTKCGVTNRKLLPDGVTSAPDRCVTCKTPHVVTRAERPVFWEATVKA
jgi:hypothetical protein